MDLQLGLSAKNFRMWAHAPLLITIPIACRVRKHRRRYIVQLVFHQGESFDCATGLLFSESNESDFKNNLSTVVALICDGIVKSGILQRLPQRFSYNVAKRSSDSFQGDARLTSSRSERSRFKRRTRIWTVSHTNDSKDAIFLMGVNLTFKLGNQLTVLPKRIGSDRILSSSTIATTLVAWHGRITNPQIMCVATMMRLRFLESTDRISLPRIWM